MNYTDFIKNKVVSIVDEGFQIEPGEINPLLKPHQRDIVQWMVRGGRRACFASFGLGKCHGAGTKILMADCSIKKVEDIKTGEKLMGDDGNPRIVSSLARGREAMYRITLKNGDSYTCNESHILSLQLSNKFRHYKSGDRVDMELREWLKLPDYAKKNCFKHYKVPLDFKNHTVPMDPYIYGAWLGDGHTNTLAWTINHKDSEIVSKIKSFAVAHNLAYRAVPGQGCTSYFLSRIVKGRASHCDEFYFVQNSGQNGKRIDDRYLQNDRETRLQLLAGIIDTDGSLIDKCFEVSTKWEGLKDDILFLCRSLGFSVSSAKKIVNDATYWRIWISGDTHLIPCITRKKAGKRRQIKNPLVYGFTVEPLGNGDYYGFEIDGNRRYLLADFTVTHNTFIQLEVVRIVRSKVGGMGLIVLPLGVRQEFVRDGEKLGTKVKFIRRIEEADDPNGIYLTNYETVRDGKLDPRLFSVASLDEAACLRGSGSTKTFREFMRLFTQDAGPMGNRRQGCEILHRFVATATPSPNDYIELLVYAAYLGILDISQSKTRFFKRDSTNADNLTLLPHKEQEFWLWVASWAVFIQKPSDLGYSDDGYVLPELDIHWHELQVNSQDTGSERNGQRRLLRNASLGVTGASREKHISLQARINKMMEIRAENPEAHRVIWHDLEAERQAIKKAVPECTVVYGSQKDEDKERAIIGFSDGEFQEIAGKPVMLGAGVNWQRYCSWGIYLGIGFKFYAFIQSVHRLQRFLQPGRVRIDLIYTDAEIGIRRTLERKWAQHNEMVRKMTDLIKEYGLSHAAMMSRLSRAMGVERVEVLGEHHKLILNDSIIETGNMEENSVGLILTSIPFSTQYEYSPNYCYDELTEVLTLRGWISFADLTLNDRIASMNLDSRQIEWQKPERVIWEPYRGRMFHFHNRNNFDLMVTPDHAMIVDSRVGNCKTGRKYKQFKRILAYKIYDGFIVRKWRMINTAAPGNGHNPQSIEIPYLRPKNKGPKPKVIRSISAADFMELAGWYLSEGYCDSLTGKHAGRISLCQCEVNPDFRKEIKALLERIGLSARPEKRAIVAHNSGLAKYLIDQFGSGSYFKKIPRWVKDLHPNLLIVLRDTMMKGDGTKTGFLYGSFSKQLRDDFQELCILTGWRATVNDKYKHVAIGQKRIYPEIRHKPQEIEYSGMIGCAKVPNGTMIVRRNGVAVVSGNCDLGHTDNNEHFFEQMDYLTPNLMRVLQPGRLMAIHVKDRIVPGGMTGLGFQTTYPFHCKCIEHYTRHGFGYMGMKTIVTDVVRENNQTYRLGWTEQCKDGSKMGVGMPEYLLIFRKPPTDTSNGYADNPIVKSKRDYRLSKWQVDAHGFSRSSGNRLLDPEEIVPQPWTDIQALPGLLAFHRLRLRPSCQDRRDAAQNEASARYVHAFATAIVEP